jgi:hypothetical protein
MTGERIIDETHRASFPIDAGMNRRHVVRVHVDFRVRARVRLCLSYARGSRHESPDHRAENCRFHSASRVETAPASSSSLGPHMSRGISLAMPGK